MATGIDTPTPINGRAKGIKDAGFSFIARYYRSSHSKYLPLTHEEATEISEADLDVVAIWEYLGNKLSSFSYTGGYDEGTSAYRQGLTVGQPAGTPIYFAVDFDAEANEIAGGVHDYFRGIQDGFRGISSGSPAYLTGVYGSGLVCSTILSLGLAQFSWLARGSKWRGSATFKMWNIKQGPASERIAFDHDTDEAAMKYGGFRV